MDMIHFMSILTIPTSPSVFRVLAMKFHFIIFDFSFHLASFTPPCGFSVAFHEHRVIADMYFSERTPSRIVLITCDHTPATTSKPSCRISNACKCLLKRRSPFRMPQPASHAITRYRYEHTSNSNSHEAEYSRERGLG
jgi:hypothetical protein